MSRRDEEFERPRMLRIEVHGLLHDWFDLDDLGDMVKSTGFNVTLRENIARYFGVPVEQQALYDEDGILASTADLRRALQRYAPKLYVYSFSEIGEQLHEKTSAQLASVSQQVEDLRAHFANAKVQRSRSEVYAVPLPASNYEVVTDTGVSNVADLRPCVPPLQSFRQDILKSKELKEFHELQEMQGLVGNSWQSSATTEGAAEAVCSQVSSSPTAMAAQVITVASNTTLASDVRELTEVETLSLGDARRPRVVEAPRVNFDLRAQVAPCPAADCGARSVQNLGLQPDVSETVQIGTRVLKPRLASGPRIVESREVQLQAMEPLQFVGNCQVQLPQSEVEVREVRETRSPLPVTHLTQARVIEAPVDRSVLEEFCPQCGQSYLADSAFCRHCGRKRDHVNISSQENVLRSRGSSLQAAILQPEAPRVTPSPPRTVSPPPSRPPAFAWQPKTPLQPLSQVLSPAVPLRQSSCRPKEDTVYVTAASCMNAAALKERSWK